MCCTIGAADYASHLMRSLVSRYLEDPEELEHSIDDVRDAVLPTLAEGTVRPEKGRAVQEFMRFNTF